MQLQLLLVTPKPNTLIQVIATSIAATLITNTNCNLQYYLQATITKTRWHYFLFKMRGKNRKKRFSFFNILMGEITMDFQIKAKSSFPNEKHFYSAKCKVGATMKLPPKKKNL